MQRRSIAYRHSLPRLLPEYRQHMAQPTYSMSFTTATLRVGASVLVAELYYRYGDWQTVRDLVVTGNLLQMRTLNASRRTCQELISRLRTLTSDQMQLVIDGAQQERSYLLWLAFCRRYTFVRDFAAEVLRDHFLLHDPRLALAAFDRFFQAKAAWHPEVARIAESTRKKQRQVVYTTLREAGLLTDDNTIIPALLTPRLVVAIRNDLPADYHDSAFLDRLHFYLLGWEVDIIRSEMFSNGYGFVVDYLAEILRNLRNHDYSHVYHEHFALGEEISTRDRTGIEKTFSGLMKILFPHGGAAAAEIEEVLRFAIEGRKRVKDQLLRIDNTYAAVQFVYSRNDGAGIGVRTLEQETYGRYYRTSPADGDSSGSDDDGFDALSSAPPDESTTTATAVPAPLEKRLVFQENQRGASFDELFGPYLRGAKHIVVTDPYIRLFYQARNLMEFLETVARFCLADDEVQVHLVTVADDFKEVQQTDYLEQMQTTCAAIGIRFTWEFDATGSLHARHIVTDHGWKILLDRGLDIFQQYDMNDAFAIANRVQKYRSLKAFEITYLRTAGDESRAAGQPMSAST